MSNEQDKVRHSNRIANKKTAVRKQVRIAKSHGIQPRQDHRYSKHHAMNCGRPNCLLCANPRRTLREKTIQEQRFEKQLAADKRRKDD